MGSLIPTVLMLFAGGTLLLSFLTYGFFWYETANSDYRARLVQLSGNRTRRWIAWGILTSWASMMFTVLLYPFGFLRRFLHPGGTPDPSSTPVILVHGLYHNASAWVLFRKWLERAGLGNVYAVNFNSMRCTFRQAVELLDRTITDVAALHPGHRVVLIGHSLGGLLSRVCLECEGRGRDVAAVITLGTPHHGSKLAALGPGRLAASIIYESPLFREIERETSPCDVPRLALYSPVDNMVLPNDALAIQDPGWTTEVIAPISHVAMLFHRPTALKAIEYIKRHT